MMERKGFRIVSLDQKGLRIFRTPEDLLPGDREHLFPKKFQLR